MQEILSRPETTKRPLRDQEFYELCLTEAYSASGPQFVVRQARARWDDEKAEPEWDLIECDQCASLTEANTRYNKRRKALAESGFTDSDMDLL